MNVDTNENDNNYRVNNNKTKNVEYKVTTTEQTPVIASRVDIEVVFVLLRYLSNFWRSRFVFN